jgi:hypothetical protein
MPRRLRTEKVSVSLRSDDLKVLRARAKRIHGGNLSAVLSDLAQVARYEEGADALVEWLGDAAKLTDAERAAFEAERRAPLAPPPSARPRARPKRRTKRKAA